MKRLLPLLVVLTLTPPALAESCGTKTYGTTVAWHDDAAVAKRLAEEQDRLLVAMHISGELGDPNLT